jgi:hypothetical protein
VAALRESLATSPEAEASAGGGGGAPPASSGFNLGVISNKEIASILRVRANTLGNAAEAKAALREALTENRVTITDVLNALNVDKVRGIARLNDLNPEGKRADVIARIAEAFGGAPAFSISGGSYEDDSEDDDLYGGDYDDIFGGCGLYGGALADSMIGWDAGSGTTTGNAVYQRLLGFIFALIMFTDIRVDSAQKILEWIAQHGLPTTKSLGDSTVRIMPKDVEDEIVAAGNADADEVNIIATWLYHAVCKNLKDFDSEVCMYHRMILVPQMTLRSTPASAKVSLVQLGRAAKMLKSIVNSSTRFGVKSESMLKKAWYERV